MQRKIKIHKVMKRTIIAIVLFVAVAVIAFFTVTIKDFKVVGCVRMTEEEVIDQIFSINLQEKYFYAIIADQLLPHKELPSIQSYELTFKNWNSVTISIQEKKAIGCFLYMNTYMYFSRDGYIIDSSTERDSSVAFIEGINFDKGVVLYQKMNTGQDQLYGNILTLTQLLELYEISVDLISYDADGNASITMGAVKVMLGDSSNMEGKIAELKDMMSGLTGLSGILHLESYDETNKNPSYRFERS